MPHPLTVHETRLASSAVDEAAHTRFSRRLSAIRLALACSLVALLVLAAGYGLVPAPLAWALGVIGVGAFVALVVVHDRVEHARRIAAAHVLLSHEALDRHARRWDALPVAAKIDEEPTTTDVQTSATDLDLFGRASLRQLFGRTATPGGARFLHRWMEEATKRAPDDLHARQEAIRDLAPLLDHRHALLAESLATTDLRHGSEASIQRWVTAPSSVLAQPGLAIAALAVPLAAIVLIVLDQRGVRVGGWWVLVVSTAWGARALLGRAIGRAFAGSDALSGEVRRYAAFLARWEALPVTSPLLVSLQTRLTAGSTSASRAMASLGRLVDLADLRWSHLPHAFVHSLTAWDVHVASALERWNTRHGRQVDDWFDALSQLDALSTLAGLAHDEPEWAFPSTDAAKQPPGLSAVDLAHPLIAAPTRVGNDVHVGPPGSVLVVTGSNMSGKSTLLRAIGLNVVLAQMGAPVCARSMSLPSTRLETSIRIDDSLADGVSYFMAALLRLKQIVSAADEPWQIGQPRVLYLLDEVLQGTNSDERQIAIRHIVRHLVASPAIGALTTHDLHLVHTPEFRAHAQHVHFTEHVEPGAEPPVMHFDYQLRAGPAQSRNALALVRMVGLGDATLPEPS